MAGRWILHADMDAFYASVEQRDAPELRGRPVIVGGTSRRGVVSAASYEARAFGVRSAMPTFRARRLCPDGVFLPGDLERYARVSRQVHEVFGEFTPEIEPISLDEAFLDVTGSLTLFGGPAALAARLKARVREAVDLPVTVALAPSKLVAKIACALAKPDGLRIVAPDEVAGFLAPLPVRRLWGVGPVLEAELARQGLATIGDLAARGPTEELRRLARGADPRPVDGHAPARSYGEESTFARDLSDRDAIVAALAGHAEAVARRLRRDGVRGRTVTVKIKLARRAGTRAPRLGADPEPIYPLWTRSRTLVAPTDDGATVREVAVALWDAAGVREPVRLLGVSVSALAAAGSPQLELFAARPGRRERLNRALDAISDRFGADAVRPATVAPERASSPGRTHKRGT